MGQVNLSQGLVAHYPFNGNANDVSGNGFHGTMQNGVTFVPDRTGIPNSAVHFDGIDDFIEVIHNGALSRRGGFSYVVYFKTENLSAVQTLLARRNRGDQTQAQFQVFINWSVHPGVGYGHNYSNNSDCPTPLWQYNVYVNTGSSSVNLNQWHCVVGTFDGTTQKIYLDGILKESLPTPLPLMDSCGVVPMTIAKYTNPDPQFYKGAIDEVRVYNRALNQDEVNALCVICPPSDFDFGYSIDPCNPLAVQFNGMGSISLPDGDFGDGNVWAGNLNPLHSYSAPGNYLVQYYVTNGACRDTIRKTISVGVINENIILTQDTTICLGATKKILTTPALDFCWTPVAYLDDPNSPQPTTSTPQNITYYYTAEVTGNNLITNGSFSAGNSGFTSEYNYATSNSTEGQYFVGTNPNAWNGALSNCPDHTGSSGNMLLVNGAPVANVNVWRQSVAVTPNTNYAFSTWIQSVSAPNPAQLQFSINGKDLGTLITASATPCNWTRFYTTWNSGPNSNATIGIVNKNTLAAGNDFALDDISFAPVFIKRDSVKITVDTPNIQASADTAICKGTSAQLNVIGAQQYTWSPSAGLSNSAISNPIATPSFPTQYIVTGTNSRGCIDKDTVNVTFVPVPQINISNDTSICYNTSAQLFASGGSTYSWYPSNTLNNSAIHNPIASPIDSTKYYVQISDGVCNYFDSVQVNVIPVPLFSVNADTFVCIGDSVQLNASGGDLYSWQPGLSLSNIGISNPKAFPSIFTTYTVTITETTCNNSTVLSTDVMVRPLPTVAANKSNDLDCSMDRAQLIAVGASQYSWLPIGTLSDAGVSNPIASPTSTTEYIVKGTDINGCEAYDTIIVNVDEVNRGGYLMPTAFTPNKDGLNDCYRIKYWGMIEELDFSIYNRWGERIFHTKDPDACWDGTVRGVSQNTGVFIYVIRARTFCESHVFRKGTFTLIR
jgi:gliding motility-associated-like protein